MVSCTIWDRRDHEIVQAVKVTFGLILYRTEETVILYRQQKSPTVSCTIWDRRDHEIVQAVKVAYCIMYYMGQKRP